MTERTRRLVLRATLPIVALFAASIVGANLFAATPAASASGPNCSQMGNTTFWGLDNNIHPGEIGFQTAIGCDKPATIDVGSCMEHLIFGNWVENLYGCAQKGPKSGVLALTHTLWFSCAGGITQTDSTTYRGHSSYNVTGQSPNVQVITGQHGSRCLDAQVAQSG